MTELARISLPAISTGTSAPGRKVMGKMLVAVSALGMLAVLASLAQGRLVLAGSAFLLTIGVLEMMFQRAVAVFHDSAAPHQLHGHGIRHRAPRHAAARD